MKKILSTLLLAAAALTQLSALTRDEIREEARFLSDRMAHELNLTEQQYEDCYEINYDFISSINPYMDDVVRGYDAAYDHYYDFLDYRNEDLRYVMTDLQYTSFLACEYFLRPIYLNAGHWFFRIHDIYRGWSFFFNAPHVYYSYYGGHGRPHHPGGFYAGRYHHSIYGHPHHIERHHPGGHRPGGSSHHAYDRHQRNGFHGGGAGESHHERGGGTYHQRGGSAGNDRGYSGNGHGNGNAGRDNSGNGRGNSNAGRGNSSSDRSHGSSSSHSGGGEGGHTRGGAGRH